MTTPLAPEPRRLSDLAQGEAATVDHLTAHGEDRLRLLDLGLTPGATVVAEMRAPLGSPVAYRIRGALIALREEQARQVVLRELDENDTQGDNA